MCTLIINSTKVRIASTYEEASQSFEKKLTKKQVKKVVTPTVTTEEKQSFTSTCERQAMRQTRNQADFRVHNNVTRKTIHRHGKAVQTFICHDSHGIHGRKPLYKDRFVNIPTF